MRTSFLPEYLGLHTESSPTFFYILSFEIQNVDKTIEKLIFAFFHNSILFGLIMVKITTGLLKFKNYLNQKAKKQKVVVLIIYG